MDNKEFYDLLLSVKMESYFTFLKDSGVTLNNLKYLTEKDIIDLFGKSIGVRAQFRAVVNEYRKINDLPRLNSFTCCCQSRDDNETIIRQNIDCSDSTNSLVTAQGSYVFNMDVFLNSNVGKKILENYKEKNYFSVKEREFLASSIVKCHLENNTSMTLAILDNIASRIASTFKGESKKYYFEKEPYTRGKLYTKYRALSKTYKKSGIFTDIIRIKSKSLGESSSDQDVASEQIELFQDDIDWLYHNMSPWVTVETKWKNTFVIRKLEVEKKSNSLFHILEKWPLLRHTDAARLIEIDFKTIFPDKSNLLFENFEKIEPDLENIFKKNIKYGPGKEILKNLSLNKEYRRLQFMQLFNVIVKPTARKKVDDVLWKVSISDGWNSFLIFVDKISKIPAAINKRYEFCIKKKITLQPVIIVVSEENSSEFIVVADSIFYKFKEFLTALDILFKLFFVLNISYPFESSTFFNFLQDFFYNIESSIDFSNYKYLFNLDK